MDLEDFEGLSVEISASFLFSEEEHGFGTIEQMVAGRGPKRWSFRRWPKRNQPGYS